MGSYIASESFNGAVNGEEGAFNFVHSNTGYILISAGMYWIRTKYQIDENSQALQETKLKRDGLRGMSVLAL